MLVANQLTQGLPYTMPAHWHHLSVAEQARGLVRAEARRIADARLYAFDDNAVSAVRSVADDLQVQLPVTPDLLPAPSGMIVFTSPVSVSADEGIITAATWGPAMEGFGDGVHLSWWTDTRAFIAREVASGHLDPAEAEFRKRTFGPLMLHVDMHLPFAPLMDGRLFPVAEFAGADRDSAPAIRAIVAAWYALTHQLVLVREARADMELGRALAAEKAKYRGVLVARAEDPTALADALADQAHAAAGRFGSRILGGLSSPDRARAGEGDETFLPSRDEELEPSERWLPQLYRDAVRPLELLEAEAQQRYPGIFDHLEELRVREYGSWPGWCWMPSSRVAIAIGDLGLAKDVDRTLQDAIVIAGLGAWRARRRPAIVLDWLPAPEDRAELCPSEVPDKLPVFGVELVHTKIQDG
ncbi:hypothetical protein [Streptomyces sp. NPDC058268]|uniref:hypothetical protein n=1 Tax=Streptomyces sp. NPDC058268 TaxID=3346413 RepID=UPI0036EB3390